MKIINGFYPASVTPYKENGSICFEALEKLMQHNINEGASGFFAGGSSAECFLLTENERISLFETACNFKDEAVIIAHVGAIGTDEAIRYAKAAKNFGIQYISSTPPFYYGYSNKQIAGYFYDIADAAGMQVMIYNFPGFTGKSFNISDPDIRSLFCSDIVCGIKHTDRDLSLFERIRDLNPDISIMSGYEDTMTAALALGADGSIGSTFNVTLPHFNKIFDAYKSSDIETAIKLQSKANNILEAFMKTGLIASIKYILSLQGIDTGPPRKPFTTLLPDQMEYIREVYEQNIEKGQ